MADPVKRLNYFDHQFLRAKDFTDEQAYHIRLRRLHNQLLHVWGIANGLDLAAPAGSTTVTVRQGVAIDGLGRELVLPADTQTVDLSGFLNKPVFITLRYDEQPSDPTTETGAAGSTRSTEMPIIDVSPNPPADASQHLILGQAVIGADGKVASTNPGTDPNRRRSAGVVGGDLSVSSLTIGDASISTDRWAHVRLGAPNRIDSDSALRIAGNLGVGTDPSTVAADFGGPGRIRVRQGAAGTAGVVFNEGAKGDRAFVGMVDDNNVGFWGSAASWGLVMNADNGNVGIGTTTPLRKLQVGGDVIGLSFDPGVTPNAGVVRFGDNTGWKLHFGRSREASGGALNSGTNGLLMTIQDNGNVGIGTASPAQRLEVAGNLKLSGGRTTIFTQGDNNTTHVGGVQFLTNDNGVTNLWTPTDPSGTPLNATIRLGGFGLFNNNIVNLQVSGSVGIGLAPSDMVLDVASRMRVRMGGTPSAGIWMNQNAAGDRAFVGMSDDDHVGLWGNQGVGWGFVMHTTSGNVGIGTAAPLRTLDVRATGIKLGLEANGGGQLILANNPNDNRIYLEAFNTAGNGSAAEMLLTGMNATNVPQLTFAANVTQANGQLNVLGNAFKPGGGAWGAISDARLKKNVSSLQGALDKLLSLRGVTYEWNEPEKFGNLVGVQMGLVAQEVEPVFPEWVGTDLDGAKNLSIRGFEALTIEAIREIRDQIEALKNAVGDLKPH